MLGGEQRWRASSASMLVGESLGLERALAPLAGPFSSSSRLPTPSRPPATRLVQGLEVKALVPVWVRVLCPNVEALAARECVFGPHLERFGTAPACAHPPAARLTSMRPAAAADVA